MERIRIIGRIDLAEQVHAALVAVGAEAHLATAAPTAVISQTGRDGTGIDVLANALDLCSGIKKAAPARPVVLVVWDDPGSELAGMTAESAAKTARGPDVHLPWPATGREILAACERAKETAHVRRPRILWQEALVSLIVVAAFGWQLASVLRAVTASGLPSVVVQLVQAGTCAASASWSWRRARTSSHPRWHRRWAVFALALAVSSLLGAIAVLFE